MPILRERLSQLPIMEERIPNREHTRLLHMSSFTYRCPKAGLRVQSFASTKPLVDGCERVECVACGRVHLVDPATGKVVGEDSEQPPKDSE